MIYEHQVKNIFTFLPNRILTCTVNCVGVMGKGIALEFKTKYPNFYTSYVSACKSGLIRIGKCWEWKHDDLHFICFPTKTHWALPSKISYIEKGLVSFKQIRNEHPIVIPKLGCGNGGLKCEDVKPLILNELADSEQQYILLG